MPKLGDWKLIVGEEEEGGEGWKIYFSYFKKHSVCIFRISLLYLGHGALNNRPASRAARKEN